MGSSGREKLPRDGGEGNGARRAARQLAFRAQSRNRDADHRIVLCLPALISLGGKIGPIGAKRSDLTCVAGF